MVNRTMLQLAVEHILHGDLTTEQKKALARLLQSCWDWKLPPSLLATVFQVTLTLDPTSSKSDV